MIERVELDLPPGAWPTWVLSSHDYPRVRTRLGSEDAARAAAVVLTTQRGTPFVYQGDELGLQDAVVGEGRRVDPGGRDGCRAPLPWEPGPGHGWPTEHPWLPWPPEADARNAASERADRSSMLHLYRDLLAARRASPALRRGTMRLRDAPGDVLAYERAAGDDRRLVLVNFSEVPADVPLEEPWEVDVASAPQPDAGSLPPWGAALLRPAC
jgi:alpha-glucosidase